MSHLADRPRIMICEDEVMIGLHIAALVSAAGCEAVGPFNNSRDATAAFRRRQIDGAILDVDLADGASTPLAGALRDAGVQFIVTSGLMMNSPPPEFAGVEWLHKPIDEERLRAFCDKAVMACRLHAASMASSAGTGHVPGDFPV